MSSKGNPVVNTRLPRDLHAAITEQIRRSAVGHGRGPRDHAEFLRRAAREKLAKMRRSRAPRGARRRPAAAPPPEGVDTLPVAAVDSVSPAGG